MERFKTLIKLNIKRAFKSLLLLILGAIALIFLVSAIAFCGNEYLYGGLTSIAGSSDTDKAMFKIGVVMEDTSDIATTITDSITSMSEVTNSIQFIFTDEDGVMEGLERNEFIAAMIVPENTVDGIMHGANDPIYVVFPEDSGYEAIIIKELTDSIGTMLGSAQAGVYSVKDFYIDNDASSYRKEANRRMNMKYISVVATGVNMFDTTEITATGSTPLMTYYISGGLVLFMLLLGINCYSFIKKIPSNTSKRMCINGTPLILQELADYIAIASVLLVALVMVIIPAVFIMSMFGFSLSTTGIVALVLILPVFVLLSSAFVYFISRITTQNMSRIMITFISAIMMCFISGSFIPAIMLPDTLQTISLFTPAYYMMKLASKLLSGSFDSLSLFMCTVFTVVLFALGVLTSNIRLRKELR